MHDQPEQRRADALRRRGGNRTRAGYGLVVDYEAEAQLADNDFSRNPARVGVFLGSQVTHPEE